MGFWRTTRKVIGHTVDLRVDRWVDLPWLKSTTDYFWDLFRNIFKIERAQSNESFEEAVSRLQLTPEMLAKQSRNYLLLTGFFIVLTLSFWIYSGILIALKNRMGAGICFTLSLYALSLAFRFYFWHFQITHQKLGCSIYECYQFFRLHKRAPHR